MTFGFTREMTFGLTRDSASLWIGGIVALLSLIAAKLGEKSIEQWTALDYVQIAIAIGGYALGKLQTSPLPHSEDVPAVNPDPTSRR